MVALISDRSVMKRVSDTLQQATNSVAIPFDILRGRVSIETQIKNMCVRTVGHVLLVTRWLSFCSAYKS